MNKARVLIVDDEESIRRLLKSRMEREGYDTLVAADANEAEKLFGSTGNGIGTVVTDLKMPGRDGFQLMKSLKEKNIHTKYVVITGHGEKEAAIQSVKYGATDYLEKPFDLEAFVHTVQRCQKEYALQVENLDLVARLEARIERVEGKAEASSWYISKSEAMTKTNEWLSVLKRESTRVEAEEPSVLILGESGTGKEGIARQVQASSRRTKGPWVAVNCANFNETLLESELFGHEKGAFTGANSLKRGLFEIARGGTLFLDEIGEMDVKLQAKLLRVLQEKVLRRVGGTGDIETDVRVVAATNVNLGEKVASGAFREDLYHRLSRVVIEVPALRTRSEDIVPMAKQFAHSAFESRGKHFSGFTPDAETAIQGYSWPGNVREMLNVIERVALVHVGNSPITPSNLTIPTGKAGQVIGFPGARANLSVVPNGGGSPSKATASAGGTTPTNTNPATNGTTETGSYMEMKKQWVDAFEKEYLVNTLTRHDGNVSAAAREAMLDRSNFLRLLRRHAVKAADFRQVGAEDDTAQAA
ncbi:MAG: sigma-54-dependent Fis family transcriptional regulator [Cryobacterium sp.]|nr:sigma-54-dependent Fis family transcriptional regulator [Oligoflexia bacterium]